MRVGEEMKRETEGWRVGKMEEQVSLRERERERERGRERGGEKIECKRRRQREERRRESRRAVMIERLENVLHIRALMMCV